MKIKSFYSVLFIALSMMVSACSESDDEGGNDSLPAGSTPSAEFTPGNLAAEPYAAEAVRIVTEDASAPFYSLELMGDGYYLLSTSRPNTLSSAKVKVDANGVSVTRKRGVKVLRAKASKEGDGTVTMYDGSQYGKFECLGNKRYRLSNGMTFDLLNVTSSDKTITYTNSDGSLSQVYVSVSEPAVGDGVKSLCRSWNFNSFEVWGYLNGAYMAHGKQTLNGGEVESTFQCSSDMFERDDFLDEDGEMCHKVIFTTAGTYICFYMDGDVEIARWAWVNAHQGTLKYWDYEGNKDYDSLWDGFVTVRFAGSQMRVYEDYTESEGGMTLRLVAVNTLTAVN